MSTPRPRLAGHPSPLAVPLAFAALLTFAACGENPTALGEDAPVAPMVSDPDVLEAADAPELPDAAAQPWEAATAAYTDLGNAVAADDLTQVQTHARRIEEALSAANVGAMGDDANLWMAHTPELRRAATRIANSDDLDESRALFEGFSEDFAGTAEAFGFGAPER